jgi:hypothetical protein
LVSCLVGKGDVIELFFSFFLGGTWGVNVC